MKKLYLSMLATIAIANGSHSIQASNMGNYAAQSAKQIGNYANQITSYTMYPFGKIELNKNNNSLTDDQKKQLLQQSSIALMQDVAQNVAVKKSIGLLDPNEKITSINNQVQSLEIQALETKNQALSLELEALKNDMQAVQKNIELLEKQVAQSNNTNA